MHTGQACLFPAKQQLDEHIFLAFIWRPSTAFENGICCKWKFTLQDFFPKYGEVFSDHSCLVIEDDLPLLLRRVASVWQLVLKRLIQCKLWAPSRQDCLYNKCSTSYRARCSGWGRHCHLQHLLWDRMLFCAKPTCLYVIRSSISCYKKNGGPHSCILCSKSYCERLETSAFLHFTSFATNSCYASIIRSFF